MKNRAILSKSISSLIILGTLGAAEVQVHAATWDGGGTGDTELGVPVNWSDDVLPDVTFGDTALWDGTVAGPLSLLYSNNAFAGVAGNPGINFRLASTQTGALNIDSGANTASLRLNDITIASGAGAFSLGDGAGVFNITLGGAGGQTHTWTNDAATAATIASDVVLGLGGGGAHSLVLGGAGNWTFNNAVGQGNGVLTLVKNGAGTLTLSGASTYTGGLVLNAGTLLINNAGAIGNTATGALTLNGGTIDNTSGAAITTTTAKAVNWNGDVTFTGTNNLNFNGGTITLGGTGSTRTINVNGGTLTAGRVLGVGYGLTKAGAGTLLLGGGNGRITGDLTVSGGTLQIGANDFVVGGGLKGSGTIENGSGTGRWLFVQGSANSTFSGTIQNGTGAGTLGLHKSGTGTLSLTGPTSYTHQTTISGGMLEFGSTSLPGISRVLSTGAGTGLVFDKSDGAVKSSFDGTGSASLTFGVRVIRSAGATGNFIVSGGTNGVDNRINLTQAAGFINQGLFFNGDNFAWMDGANTFVRGIAYGTDTGAVTSGAAASLAAATHQQFTGDITAQETAAFTTLKNSGNNAFTLATGATVTVNGILKAGNIAGGAVISGGAGLQATSGGEMVIRTAGANDNLTINTPILANGASSLTTSGAGTLTLGGVSTYTGATTINSTVNLTGSLATGLVNVAAGGILNLNTGGVINPTKGNNGQFTIGNGPGGNAILNINGGTLNAGKDGNPSFVVGGRGNAGQNPDTNDFSQNVSGFVNMTSGALNTVHELHIGNGNSAEGANAYAAFSLSGGAVTSGNWLVVGLNNDRAILNQTGGSIVVSSNRTTIGAGGAGAVGIVNQSGGTFTVAAGDNTGIFLGENGYGAYNLSGTGQLSLNTNGGANSGTMQFAGNGSSLGGNFNLNGGVLTASAITKGASTAGAVYRFNFNGGTLRPNKNNATFFADLANTEAYIYGGGATIDTNGLAITISEPLLAPLGSGLASVAVAAGGAGYLDQPVVTITGGTGTGATAIANVSGGVVTGFTITSPGTGYSPGDVLNVRLFGGGASTPATVGAITLGANVGGGLNKTGAGTLTLNALNTFTGATKVTEGELRLSNAGSLDGTSGILINGTGAKLVHNGVAPVMAPVTLTKGTLDGTGIFSAVTVSDGTGGIITHGDGTDAPLTIDSLTFNGAATLNLAVGLMQPLSVSALATGVTNAGGKVTINVTNPNGLWEFGVYNLISYSTLTGQGFANFVKGTVPNLGARQSASLSNPAGFVALTISGDLPVWTGAQNGNWTTNVVGGASNWKLQSGGTATDFITGDVVVFDDTATGATTVNISTANVSPASTTFNNSNRDYTISSGGGFGIASGSLIKNGSSSLTLTTANTYADGTTLNAGTLNLNNASAIGTGTFNIHGGAIDNTSGAAITLGTNNAQTWSGDFAFSGTNNLNLGTGAVALTADRTVTTNGKTLTVGGVISGATFGITKAGPGELVLTGANSYTGATNVSGGTLTVTGALNAPNTANIGQITVGSSSENAVLKIQGGTVNATKTAAPSIVAGNASGGTGVILMDGGTLTAPGEIWVGSAAGAYGGMTLSAGTVTSGSWLPVGRNGTGVLNVSGGTLTVNSQNYSLGSFDGAKGDVNLTGGVTSTTNTGANQGIFIVGEGGDGVLTVSGTAALNLSGALGVQMARGATGRGIVNLNGGTITTPAVTKGPGATGIFSFNGGTLRPTASNAAFMTGLTAAYVRPGGANIDTNGQNITIAQSLVAPINSGVSAIVVENGGAGYLHTPLIRIVGGAGSGATAVANVSNGVITGITITNPGSGYAPGDAVSVTIEGGGASTPATIGSTTLVANSASGGLNKQGAGTLTLSGTSTYGGATNITGGTLRLDATGSINGSSGITINGTGAKLVQSNTTTPLTPTVNVTNGTLDGTGTINTAVIGNGSVVANGDGGKGVLTFGALTFSGTGTININTGGEQGLAVTGALTTNGPGTILLNVPGGFPWATGSTYDLISFGTLNGTINDFTIGAISGLGARQIPSALVHGSNIALLINGDTPVWTGAVSGAWTTAAIGAPFNWKLQIAGTGTEFLSNDQVIFDDSATGTTSVNIADAAVNTAGVTFNNSTKDYTISGAFGIASGLILKNGTGSVTISTANTYTGGTTVNNGTLILSGNNNFGAGAITVNGGTATFSGSNTSTGGATVNNGTLALSGNNNFGAGAITVNGGTAVLSGSNTYTGATTVNGGLLDLRNAAALGTSVLTLKGGTLDNTSGGEITLTNANAQNWNGDFTFAGTSNLNFNNGAVTIGGAPGQRTVNIAGGRLSTGVITSAAGIGLTKTGSGVLAMTSTANTSIIGGLLDVQSGTLQILGDLTVNGGLSGGGTIENGGAASKWFFVNNPGDTTFSGSIRDNPNNAAVRLGLVKRGAGTLNLTGAENRTTDRFAIEQGAIRVTGKYTAGFGIANEQTALVGNVGGQSGTLIIDGGTFNAEKTSAASLSVGAAANAVGVLKMTSGEINAANELWVADVANSYGALIMSGGTINSAGWLPVARTGKGVADISGGTINVTGQNYTMGSFGGGDGVTNLSGGTINTLSTAANQGGFLIAEGGNGTLNLSGTGAVNISGARGLHLAAGNGTGIVNLNGGTVTTPLIQKNTGLPGSAGTGYLNLNGGTIKASADSANFMQELTAAYVNAGGAVIDDGGFNITVAQPLLAPTGDGVSQVNFTPGGGYVGAPLVQIIGDGTGATGVARIDDNGNLTGITITNPGVDYTYASAVLIGGGGQAFADEVELGANTSGGFTKKGSGTLTLSGESTYTGPTVIESGTLALTGAISGSTSINVKSGATFDVSGADAFAVAAGQTLKGSGNVIGPVTMEEGAKLAPGDGVGTLTFAGSLDLTLAVTPVASAALQFELGSPASDKVVFTTGSLTIGTGVLGFDDFTFIAAPGIVDGTYTLFHGTSPIQGSLDSNPANLTGTFFGFTGTLALAEGGNDLVLIVVPEPGSAMLLVTGLGSLLGMRRLRRLRRLRRRSVEA